ncbi:MAG: tyrosine-protein phosphatase [Gammaproteobacteria bacterium]|nr:tyrosine-protein phosphatase [Gammaproteobacteria bacterium]
MSVTDSTARPRRLPLQGTPNFRDMGGYLSTDGRRVKWGYLFRSGQLSNLSASDQALLGELGLDVVCDFRRTEEQQRDPSRLPEPGPRVVSLPITPGSNDSFLDQASSHWQADRRLMFDFMLDINRDFALQQGEIYACMFDLLLQSEDTRMLVHCAAGKDRTGFAAAIILLALGVSRELVMEDYLLSAHYFHPAREIERLRDKYGMEELETEALLPVLEVHPEYLQAAFDAIDAEFASLEDYLDRHLGVDADKRALLRSRYLS